MMQKRCYKTAGNWKILIGQKLDCTFKLLKPPARLCGASLVEVFSRSQEGIQNQEQFF